MGRRARRRNRRRRQHHHRRGNHGAYPGGFTSPGVAAASGYIACSVFLAIFGFVCLMIGAGLMAIGYSNTFVGIAPGITGTLMFAVGVGLVTTCCVLCYCARKKRQQDLTVVNQQVAVGTTLGYGQPGGMQHIVQPPPPPGTVAYGPGGGPIASQAAPPGVTIVYGPGAQTQAEFQPQSQQYPNQPYPATDAYPPAQAGVPYPTQPDVPYPPQPVSELAGQPAPPPPPYDEVVGSHTVAVNIDMSTTL